MGYGIAKVALNALRANKARGILTTLGIIIGIVAVVTTMTAANGLSNSFKEIISGDRFGRAVCVAHAVGAYGRLV
ncbi:MAG: hypothetical protein R3C26_05890 [Calditrichia bacterium]